MSRFAILAVLALAAVANAQVCSNAYGDANCATITNLCEGARSWMQGNCAKACNYCTTAPVVVANACADINVGCPQWKDSCTLAGTKAWMVVNCPATCSICSTQTGASTCVNIEPTTTCTANRDLCTTGAYTAWMATNCALTCGSCSTTTVAASACKDLDTRCPSWTNYCTNAQYVAWMKPNCAATCNHCGAASCANVEADASCEAAKTGGYCTNTQWASWMATNCKKTCGCNTATAAPQAACVDDDSRCAGWSSYCDNALYSNFMTTSCKKTCKICTDAGDKVGACTFKEYKKMKFRASYANDDATNYVTLTQVKAKCVEYGEKCCGVMANYGGATHVYQVSGCGGNSTHPSNEAELFATDVWDAWTKTCECADIEPSNTCTANVALCTSGDYIEWMKTNCKKACGLCPAATAAPTNATAAPTPAPTPAPTAAPVFANTYDCAANTNDVSNDNLAAPFTSATTITTSAIGQLVNDGAAEAYKADTVELCQKRCTDAGDHCKGIVYVSAGTWQKICTLKSVYNSANAGNATSPGPVYIASGIQYCKRS